VITIAEARTTRQQHDYRISIQTTLDLYTDEDLDEMIAAQEKFLEADSNRGAFSRRCGWDCG
jgi:hypothetical protein